jgi:hypothetical protein
MSAASTSSRAIFFVFAICLIGGRPTYSQNANSLNPSKTIGNRTNSGAWLAKCAAPSMPTLAGIRPDEGVEWRPIPIGTTVDPSMASYPNASCVEPAASLATRSPASADNLCRADAASGESAARAFSCNISPNTDAIPEELSALGKAGVKIARAREAVLDILRSDNACTAWIETKDGNPAGTFRTLGFAVDTHGPLDIFASSEDRSIVVMRQPYVARATQDGGAHTIITINAHGAFYRPQGQVLKSPREGGPLLREGTHLLTVGAYEGDTLPAQMVTLLHEFGHIIDLLPEDADNLDGKSMKNTDEVLRHCRAEVEARINQPRALAAR